MLLYSTKHYEKNDTYVHIQEFLHLNVHPYLKRKNVPVKRNKPKDRKKEFFPHHNSFLWSGLEGCRNMSPSLQGAAATAKTEGWFLAGTRKAISRGCLHRNYTSRHSLSVYLVFLYHISLIKAAFHLGILFSLKVCIAVVLNQQRLQEKHACVPWSSKNRCLPSFVLLYTLWTSQSHTVNQSASFETWEPRAVNFFGLRTTFTT